MTHEKVMQYAGFAFRNRTTTLVGEVVKINPKTVWVRIPEILSPKGRLLRATHVIKRHKVKDAVVLGEKFIYVEDEVNA